MALPAGDPAPSRISTPYTDARLTNRLAMAYLLDAIAIFRGESHLIDALLTTAISQANVAQISRQADLQVTYAAAEAAPPDEMRRPVSVNALAASLGLPFETVRRRVRGLLERGVCVAVDGGVVIPTRVVSSPQYFEDTSRAYERLRAFYYQLRELGLLANLPPASVELDDGLVPLRTVARLSADYGLRVVDSLMRAVGDLMTGVILIEVLRSNTEHLPPTQRGGEGATPEHFVPDELRRPASISAVARRIGLPIETVRRHSAELLARGLCVRVKGGLVVPNEALARPAIAAFGADHLVNLHRMFSSLAQLGVLALWDKARPPA